jgi:PKD repeat protein
MLRYAPVVRGGPFAAMTHRFLRYLAAAALLLLLIGFFSPPAVGQSTSRSVQANHPVVSASRHDKSGLLSVLPQLPPRAVGAVLRRKLLPNRVGSSGAVGDGALQIEDVGEGSSATSLANFEGVNNRNLVLPPDTVGDIGPDHYVQMVNLSLAIWDRNGTLLYGPVDASTLWQGFGGPCATTNDGDPIVLYDQLADRWMLSQFALPNYPSGPFYQCIAVSQSGDPLGAYHRYEFKVSDTKLNDYPKFGVWPDGYYMSVNQFSCVIFCTWAGQGVVSFERERMLNGQAASMVYFDLNGVDPDLGGMLPADLDGPAPPAGAPIPFCQVDDDAWGYSPDQIQCWTFHSDWANPAASTFTFEDAHVTAAFDSNMCAYSRNCIPQRDTTVRVDAISDRLMFRLQYRNFGTHETLVTNHTVDANGLDRAGIRWYELRKAGANWNIHQQGTYAPAADGHHRWMGSAAMNGAGDIALGFSISGATVFPSIRATGRLASDANGQMTQAELTIVNGSGHQTHSSGRWGDYSTMSVDPADDCTFWYTQEYYGSNTSSAWRTRVGAFRLADCGPVDGPPSVSIVTPADGNTLSGSVGIVIAADDNEDADGLLNVEWNVDGGEWQPAAYSGSGSQYTATWNTTAVPDGVHTLNARATDSAGNAATDSSGVSVENVNEPPIATFTYSCSGLTCSFNGTGSSDPDGTINQYSWAFGDGAQGAGPTPSRAYAASGTYTVVLTVTDNNGSSGSTSTNVSVAATPTMMHVGDLDRVSTSQGGTWTATVTITIHDAGHIAVVGATVFGNWSNGGSASCTTGNSGRCDVSLARVQKKTAIVTFSVTSVTRSSSVYAPSANHDPDGDSAGTIVQVPKP